MDRRQLLKAGLALPFACAGGAAAKDPIFIGDMHYHLLFIGPNPASSQPLAKNMAAGNATLVAWSLDWRPAVDDGDAARLQAEGRAEGGRDGVLAREGDGARQGAHRRAEPEDREDGRRHRPGARKASPTWCCRSRVRAFSTTASPSCRRPTTWASATSSWCTTSAIRSATSRPSGPEHGGLTELRQEGRAGMQPARHPRRSRAQHERGGRAGAGHLQGADGVVAQLGDAGHAGRQWTMPVTQARQLTPGAGEGHRGQGRRRRAVGGALRRGSDAGGLRRQADGDGRLAGRGPCRFGTDMNGADRPLFQLLRRAPRRLALGAQAQGEARVRKLAIENYARVLRQAFAARQA